MKLAKRDITIINITSKIADKKKELFNKAEKLKDASRENKYLEKVIKDYKRYHDNNEEEKWQQYHALKMIVNYIDKINDDINITDEILEQTKYDQQELLKEMSNIKQELDCDKLM